jgi:hypothetical protein
VPRRSLTPPAPALDTAWFTAALTPEAALGPGDAELEIPLAAPPGKKFAEGAPLKLGVEVSRRSDLILPKRAQAMGGLARIEAHVAPFAEEAIEAEVVVRVDGVICDAEALEGAVCEPHRAFIRLPVRLARDGVDRVVFY